MRDASHLASRLKQRHLVLLTNIAKHGSLTRVAAATGISQPAATKALAELEDIFGAPLFTRTGRGMQPTPLGSLALVRARHMQNELELWAREVQALQEGHCAHLNIGVVPYVSSALLTAAIGQLHRRHGITLTLHRATTDHLMPMLRQHALDCIIGRARLQEASDDLLHQVLYHQRPRLIAHGALARRLARRKPDWAAAAALGWVLPAANTPTRQLIAEHFIAAGFRPPSPVLEAYSTDVIEGMLGANESLLSVVPQDIAAELCQRGTVGMVPWDFGWELPPINLIRRRRAQPLVAEEFFSAILRELCARHEPPQG